MRNIPLRSGLSLAVASAIAAGITVSVAQADGDESPANKPAPAEESKLRVFDLPGLNQGQYVSGDFHNHTTCSDGSTSVKTLTRESLSYLDWFIQVGHSGSGQRDCTIDDFLYFSFASEFSPGLWQNTIGSDLIKGDLVTATQSNGAEVQRMWRWQSLQEFQLDTLVTEREAPGNELKEAFLGLEWVVPGHEHGSNSIATGQYSDTPNSDAIAQFEYCFGRNSDDTSQGGGQGWTCELTTAGNDTLLSLFAGRPNEGVANYNSTLNGGINIDDGGDHVKSVAAAIWMEENFPNDGFAVGAHVERQGAFIPDDDEGYNVEHFRDYHTAAPNVYFGFESQPGHQAAFDRGTYGPRRPTAGLYTYGGTGCYAGGENTRPGRDFDGTSIDPARFLAGGDLEAVRDTEDPAKVTLCRPGVRTMWDAMLSEGRRFWFFGSSDWHNRGSFGPLDFESTLDFWPGEYQDNFTFVVDRPNRDPAQDIVDGLRSGNTYVVQGQLVTDVSFEACARGQCASMGETLSLGASGGQVTVRLVVTDPGAKSNSPYRFPNPSLAQIGITQALDNPQVAHMDIIAGAVGPHLTPADPEYFNPLAPETTRIVSSWENPSLSVEQTGDQEYTLTWTSTFSSDGYVRARASNIPPGTPNERDADGNPLSDALSDNIPCSDAACPPHINGVLNADVEAWADIWLYTNPIFIDLQD
ncbi:MAG: hypothetical protein AAF736_03380 [Pseudomonadota bacterium]